MGRECGGSERTRSGVTSVRLEGGLGDHILGMRVLSVIAQRHPHRAIVVYSDAGGHLPQLQVARMSPFVTQVVPICSTPTPGRDLGSPENVAPADLERMRAADLFIDTWGGDLFRTAARQLQVPVLDILALRPELCVPTDAQQEADRLLAGYGPGPFVGLNVTKHDLQELERARDCLVRLLRRLLEDPRVVILNIFTSEYRFLHHRAVVQLERTRLLQQTVTFAQALQRLSPRILPCADLPILVVAGLLRRCRYFVGMDNGIKHLAWALGVPHTLLYPARPSLPEIVRWIPDHDRLLPFSFTNTQLEVHIAQAKAALASSTNPGANGIHRGW